MPARKLLCRIDHAVEASECDDAHDNDPDDDARDGYRQGNGFNGGCHDAADGFVDPCQRVDQGDCLHDRQRGQLMPGVEDSAEEDDRHEETREHSGDL